MALDYVAMHRTMRNVVGVCPCCGELFRLSEIEIVSRARFRPDWLDTLEDRHARAQQRLDSLDARKQALKEARAEEARRQLPRLVRKAAPLIARMGFHPQEVKPLFHPIDLVAFDGLKSASERVQRVVLLDSQKADAARKRLQENIRSVVKQGDYHWETVQVADDGTIGIRED